MEEKLTDERLSVTARERAVLEAIASGLSSKECARELGIAPRTVEREAESLRHRLDARNMPHLVAKALTNGLL